VKLPIYPPSDDTFLLIDSLPRSLHNKSVLEVGTGSGTVAKTALEKGASSVLATDSSLDAAKTAKKLGIEVIVGDLLAFLNENAKFDLILFNPPYLASDKADSIRWTGGKGGWEISYKFVLQCKSHVKKGGRMILVASSLTNKALVRNIKRSGLSISTIKKKSFFFETLYTYSIRLASNRNFLLKNRLKNGLIGLAINQKRLLRVDQKINIKIIKHKMQALYQSRFR